MNSKLAFTALIIFTSAVSASKNSPALAQTSGCGSGYSWYLTRVGSPIAANQFRVACNEHDACYDSFGKSKQECDKAFHNRMLDICARDHNTIIGRPLRAACNGRADAYYTAVLEYGRDSYRSAQASAKRGGSTQFPHGGLYFTDRSTTFFSQDGNWHCAFATPGQYLIHQKAFPVKANAGIQSPAKYGNFIGTCGVPPVYFGREDGATFFSKNGETHCVFQSPQNYQTHQARNRDRTILNIGLQDAAKFGLFTGACAV